MNFTQGFPSCRGLLSIFGHGLAPYRIGPKSITAIKKRHVRSAYSKVTPRWRQST